MIKNYITLTKPGIIFGNATTMTCGFVLASKMAFDPVLFFITLLGLSLVIGAACVCNNYSDQSIDIKMQRTKNRPLVQGSVLPKNALLFAFFLASTGFSLLHCYTNYLTTYVAAFGFAIYVFAYGFLKARSTHATLIGSLSGATPPVVGYLAVTNTFDTAAFLLYSVVVFWQMPHFFAIAMYRVSDYAAAGIPVLPVVRGSFTTKCNMLAYVVAFGFSASLLTLFGYAGYISLMTTLLLTAYWLWLSFQGFSVSDDILWAKKMFFYSLVVIMVLSSAICVDVFVTTLTEA